MAERSNCARQHQIEARDRSLELPVSESPYAPLDFCVQLLGGSGTAFAQAGDRIDDVADRLFSVGDLQRPRAASMISRARFESTTRPWRYDSSAASMPASSSGVSIGASSSRASMPYRPAGSPRSPGGTTRPFHWRVRSWRALPDTLRP